MQRDRVAIAAGLVVVIALCWAWIVPMARDMYGPMTGASAWMMIATWDARYLTLLWAMWSVMMAGMMLPSAVPMLLLYANADRQRAGAASSHARVYALAAGYLLVWVVFSVLVTLLQWMLSGMLAMTPMMEATPRVAAILLMTAGIYQLSPLKAACLRVCRSPLSFIAQHWRGGAGGAFRMGADHGVYCLGCCWALMLLLFAGGVMNLAVIAALTAAVLVEKLAPFGEQTARISGVLLIAAGAWVFVR
jgi:predicted metal-binding membrane protein